MTTDRKITVYSELLPAEMAEGYPSDGSRFEQRGHPSHTLTSKKVKQSIAEFSSLVSELLSSMPNNAKGFQVDEVQVHAFIDIEGGIQLLGAKLGGTVEGGLRFVWRRQN